MRQNASTRLRRATRLLIGCIGVLLVVGSTPSCGSPSLLGASAPTCSSDDLVRWERSPETAARLDAARTTTELASLATGAHHRTDVDEEPPLRVAVFNIRSGFGPDNRRAPERVREKLNQIAVTLLAEGPPDVIGLNEVDFHSRRTEFVDQAQFIAERLERAGFSYQVVRGPAWLRDTPGSEIRYGNALLVRHAIVRARHCRFSELSKCGASKAVGSLPQVALAAPWSWLSHEPRGVVVVDFRWGTRSVRAILTHLDPFSAQAREAQAAQIISGLVPSEGLVVLLGDMNAVPTQQTLHRPWFSADRTHDVLTAGRLYDARSELAGDDPSSWKQWATYPARAPRLPLDGIFPSADLAALSLRVIGLGLSDHLGLVGSLSPVDDPRLLQLRREHQASLRAGRFRRIEACDLPRGARASFLSWLHGTTVGDERGGNPSAAAAAAAADTAPYAGRSPAQSRDNAVR